MSPRKRLVVVIALVAVGGGTALTVSAMRPSCAEVFGRDDIEIPAASVARGAIRFFCYQVDDGERLRFILARDTDGALHSALDSCEQCGAFHKGYASSRNEVVCRFCGNRYKIKELEQGKASCIPIGLKTAQHDGRIEIKVSDLKKAE